MEHLIPAAWFQGLSQWALLAIGGVAVAVLAWGADRLIEGASGLAYRFGLSKVIVGATVVSLGTTSPECAVSVMAAWSGKPGLALGNAVGSIVVDTGLIFGIGCLLTRLPADRFVLSRQGWVQFGSGVLLAAACYGTWLVAGPAAVLGRWFGLLLLALLAAYLWVSVRWSREHRTIETIQADPQSRPAWRLLAAVVFGLGVVVVTSRVVILSGSELAEVHWGVPQVVIAGTLVAFGTSLPELVVGLTSVFKGHAEILVGNVIGADVLNVLFVVGAAAAAAPLPIFEPGTRVPGILLTVHLPAMLLILGLFRVFIRSAIRRGTFQRWQGIPLIALYVAYAVVQYGLSVG